MPRKSWNIMLDGQPRQLDLEHSPVTGKFKLSVDGWTVIDDRLPDQGGEFKVDYHGHEILIASQAKGLSYVYGLLIDGISSETGQAGARRVMPAGLQGAIG